MTNAVPLAHERQAFPGGGLDALVATAARDCPDLTLFADDAGSCSAGDVARRVARLAMLLRHAGFSPGERLLISAGTTTEALVALVAVMRAGLEPALVPVDLGPVELAAHARAAAAVGLIGPSHHGGRERGEAYLSAAALAETIRMIATQGPQPVDGAVDVSFASLDAMADLGDRIADGAPSAVATFEGGHATPKLVSHRQAALFADALSLVEQARINPSARLVSTLPPSTLAGLVAGPFAALIGASSLRLHGPFDSAAFLKACDGEPGFHLVAPAAIGGIFEERSLSLNVASLILVSRFPEAGAFEVPVPVSCDRPVVDLYAFGEETVLAQRRSDGRSQPPSRVTDKSHSGSLGAQLNRAHAEHRLHGAEG